MTRALAERTRHGLIKHGVSRYENEFASKIDDSWAQERAGTMAVSVAGNYFILGFEREAEEWYLKAAEAFLLVAKLSPKWETDEEFRSRIEFGIGKCLWRAGREEESKPHLNSVITIYARMLTEAEKRNDRGGIGFALVRLTYAHVYLGSYEKALMYAERWTNDARRDYQKLKKTKSIPKLSPSESWLYSSCKAMVDRDTESFERAERELEPQINRMLVVANPRGYENDFLLILEEARQDVRH